MATIRELASGKVRVQVRRDGYPPLSAMLKNATEAKARARKKVEESEGRRCV